MLLRHLSKITRTSNYDFFDRSRYLRLDRNERSYPFSRKILSIIKSSISNNVLQSYPGTKIKLEELISKKEKINKRYINVIPGSDGAIKYIFEIFSAGNKTLSSIYPTYGMIDIYSKVYQYNLRKVVVKNPKDLNIEKFFSKKTCFIYIANPNQPSGFYINKKIISKILQKALKKNIYVIIDEAYIDFCDFASISFLVKKFKNLIVLKTFSKSPGIAGLRIGYMLANPIINKAFNAVRPTFDVSYFSMKIAEFFINNNKIKNQFIKTIKKSKKFVIKQCIKRKLEFQNTQTNFIIIKFPKNKIRKIHKHMFKNKILVRSNYIGHYKNFGSSIRITIGDKKQMINFFTYLDKIYKVEWKK